METRGFPSVGKGFSVVTSAMDAGGGEVSAGLRQRPRPEYPVHTRDLVLGKADPLSAHLFFDPRVKKYSVTSPISLSRVLVRWGPSS